MPTPPTGTVTFLFTDIEGSTKLWEQHPDAMKAALAQHDALLRQAIESHHGYVFKTVGDAFCAAFATATDALNAALTVQRALQRMKDEVGRMNDQADFILSPSLEGHPSSFILRVRMGLHTGTAEERDGDYFGTTVNHVARIMSVAHGGQILLSLATAELVRGQLSDGVTLRDMGEHRLKGLVNPEHILQIVAADLSSDFPPLVSLNTIPNNLPTQLTSFIGREKEIVEVKRLLTDKDLTGVQRGNLSGLPPRLLTLTGVGGTGKTRLSLQVGAHLCVRPLGADTQVSPYPDGVWFIELAPLSDPALIPQTVASVLGLREEQGRPLLDTTCDYLRAKTVLLILDNCEHLIEACAHFADTVLRATPNLKILASSREALGIAGELAWHVPSLAVPPNFRSLQDFGSLEQLTQYESVKLFIERAVFALSSFTVTNANAPAVAQICHRLDGIPLAIELAAARVKALSVEQIAARLDNRFRLLTGGSRTAVPRQQTLRALIDWSYSLLSEPERVLLRRLSVFAGGWTLEAAEVVCGDDDVGANRNSPVQLKADDVLDLIGQLVNKSLVVVDDNEGSDTRYRMLETIRQYAREKLLDAGEGEQVRDQHLDYFVKLGEEAAPKLQGRELISWLNRLEMEIDNVRAALDWSKETRRSEDGLRLAAALFWFWSLRDYQAEGLEWLQILLAQPVSAENTAVRARAFLRLGEIHHRRGNHTEAYLITEKALAMGEKLDQRQIIVRAYGLLGLIATNQGNYATAQSFYERSLAIGQALDDKAGITWSLSGMGELALRQGDVTRAQTLFADVILLHQEFADKNVISYTARRWGQALLHQGDYQSARAKFQESLADNMEIGDPPAIAACLATFAALSLAQEKLSLAAQLFGAAESVIESIHTKLTPYDHDEYFRNVAALRAQLSAADFDAAWAAGRKLTLEEAVQLAMEA